jgi:hypothetical protein
VKSWLGTGKALGLFTVYPEKRYQLWNCLKNLLKVETKFTDCQWKFFYDRCLNVQRMILKLKK